MGKHLIGRTRSRVTIYIDPQVWMLARSISSFEVGKINSRNFIERSILQSFPKEVEHSEERYHAHNLFNKELVLHKKLMAELQKEESEK